MNLIQEVDPYLDIDGPYENTHWTTADTAVSLAGIAVAYGPLALVAWAVLALLR